jgi:hypothetical protein
MGDTKVERLVGSTEDKGAKARLLDEDEVEKLEEEQRLKDEKEARQ